MKRFEKPFKTHISFELIPKTPLEQFEEISDVILFGLFFKFILSEGSKSFHTASNINYIVFGALTLT